MEAGAHPGRLLTKFIEVEWSSEWRGFWLNPQPYLAELPKFADDLPRGAAEFALDPGHYDFYGPRCVKDLVLVDISVDLNLDAVLEICFDPNEWKHESGLVLTYERVSRLDVNVKEAGKGLQQLGTFLLDEVLPSEYGCEHEILLTGGAISISCADLSFRWGGRAS